MMKQKAKLWKAPAGYLTRQQTMDRLGISGSTLSRIINEGNFTEEGETIRFRGKRLFRADAVEKYFADQVKACY